MQANVMSDMKDYVIPYCRFLNLSQNKIDYHKNNKWDKKVVVTVSSTSKVIVTTYHHHKNINKYKVTSPVHQYKVMSLVMYLRDHFLSSNPQMNLFLL